MDEMPAGLLYSNNLLRPKNIVVVGGTGVLGRAIVYDVWQNGADVLATYCHSKPDITDELFSKGRIQVAKYDVRYRDSLQFGGNNAKIDGLVYCVGVNHPCYFPAASEVEWREILEINLIGAFRTVESLLSQLSLAVSIVFIGSSSAFTGGPVTPHYAASKAGMIALMQNLARYLAPSGRCNLVAPGYIESDMANKGSAFPQVQTLIDSIPLLRLGKPQDVAHAVSYLLSDNANYVTGQVLHVNGGLCW